jgi:hypothetical protein
MSRRGLAAGLRAASLGLLLALAVGMADHAVAAEQGPAWTALSAQQRSVLAPLRADWSAIDASRKQKWLEMAARFPELPPTERERIQARMAAWAKLSPAERSRARLQFQETRQQLSSEDRRERWSAYQALPEAQRVELARRARQEQRGEDRTAKSRAEAQAARSGRGPKAPADEAVAASGKRNLVVPQRPSPQRALSPSVVQAQPGATTNLVSKRPEPPAHHQPGLPKIAAMPGFVDPQTLLPQRGPQGAAVRKPPVADKARE